MNRIIDRLGDRNRERKYRIFNEYFKPDESTKILDVGASEKEYRETSNILEKRYPYSKNITVLGVDKFEQFGKRHPNVNIVRYGGGRFPFKNNAFDICWCNAVIEHVGDLKHQTFFLEEISRVARQAFVTTPNRYFILESHSKVLLLHYLPREIFNKLLEITRNSYPGRLIHLLGLSDIKKILSMINKSRYKIIKNKICGFTIDFVIIF